MPGWHGKPYNFFGDYLREKYGKKIQKLPINAGLSCPNRDGNLDRRGCLFCSEDGSSSPTAATTTSIIGQMDEAVSRMRPSPQESGYIAYFQAFTNTYGDPARLKKLYDTAIAYPRVTGLMIGTRPDALDDEVLDLIASYARPDFELWVEIGVQSVHDRSLEFLNRHHTFHQSETAIRRCAAREINVCAHVILGIPGESWDDMMMTASSLSSLPVKGIKLHHLHVIRNTPLEALYRNGSLHLLPYDEYITILVDYLERTRGDCLIHRLAGDQHEDILVAPLWGQLKGTISRDVEDNFAMRGSWQGFLTDNES